MTNPREVETHKICSNLACTLPQPLPLTSFYYNEKRKRYASKCIKCYNLACVKSRHRTEKKFVIEADKLHPFYLWACSIVNDNADQLDPRITPGYLIALIELQKRFCLMTQIPFCMPENKSVDKDGKHFTGWLGQLSYNEQYRIPVLAMYTIHDSYLPGQFGFIVDALTPFYKLNNGLHGMWNQVFHNPAFYQYSQVMEEVKELGLNGNNS